MIPIAVGGVIKLLSDSEKREKERIAHATAQAKRELNTYNRQLERQLRKAQSCRDQNRHQLNQAKKHYQANIYENRRRKALLDRFFQYNIKYYECRTKADEFYKHINNQKKQVFDISYYIKSLYKQKEDIKKELNQKREKEDRKNLINNIRQLNVIKQQLKAEKEKEQITLSEMYDELKVLNHNTGKIRDYIRVNCGTKGHEWYMKLQERKKQKNNI